ncbi:MAG: hypothetical protein DMF80_20220 [Acidobacteria bacterium]|nr:MAG: hypothetical protein DMF80_20220 [Acidobacteriota bacterium]
MISAEASARLSMSSADAFMYRRATMRSACIRGANRQSSERENSPRTRLSRSRSQRSRVQSRTSWVTPKPTNRPSSGATVKTAAAAARFTSIKNSRIVSAERLGSLAISRRIRVSVDRAFAMQSPASDHRLRDAGLFAVI